MKVRENKVTDWTNNVLKKNKESNERWKEREKAKERNQTIE